MVLCCPAARMCMVPGSTREGDLPSPRCQHHRGFAHGSFKQQWLEAVLEQLHAHGHVLKFLWPSEALMAEGEVGSAFCCPGTPTSPGWWHVGPGSVSAIRVQWEQLLPAVSCPACLGMAGSGTFQPRSWKHRYASW